MTRTYEEEYIIESRPLYHNAAEKWLNDVASKGYELVNSFAARDDCGYFNEILFILRKKHD